MRNIKETTTRVIILFIGLVIVHFGVTLFLLANLGTDPFNVLIQGLYKLTVGLAANGAAPSQASFCRSTGGLSKR